MTKNNEQSELQPEEEPRRNLLEEANGNYIQAGVMFFDRLPLPKPVRYALKCLLIFIAAMTALCALLWPIVMRYI